MIHTCKGVFKAHNRRYLHFSYGQGKLLPDMLWAVEMGEWRVLWDEKKPFSLKVEERSSATESNGRGYLKEAKGRLGASL